MKPYLTLLFLFAFLQSRSQKPGYLDFILNQPLTPSLQNQYHLEADASAKNKYFVNGKTQQLAFYGLAVDTVWLETDKKNLIKAVTLKTASVKKEDFRDFNFEWETLLDKMSNDFGSYRTGQVKFTNTLAAIWLVQSQTWLYATVDKVYPWQKDQQRFFLIRWRKYKQFDDLQ